MTHGKGKYKTSMLAVIYWGRLHDFIQREQDHPLYPCKFIKEIIRVTLANSLRFPCANSAAMVVRFVISILYCHDNSCPSGFCWFIIGLGLGL